MSDYNDGQDLDSYSDWDPNFDTYPDDEMHPEEDYTGRPVEESDTRVGDVHHEDCPSPEEEPSWDCCKNLWEDKYQKKREQELEEMHQEWWQ